MSCCHCRWNGVQRSRPEITLYTSGRQPSPRSLSIYTFLFHNFPSFGPVVDSCFFGYQQVFLIFPILDYQVFPKNLLVFYKLLQAFVTHRFSQFYVSFHSFSQMFLHQIFKSFESFFSRSVSSVFRWLVLGLSDMIDS